MFSYTMFLKISLISSTCAEAFYDCYSEKMDWLHVEPSLVEISSAFLCLEMMVDDGCMLG